MLYYSDNADYFPNICVDVSVDDQLGGGYDGRRLTLANKLRPRFVPGYAPDNPGRTTFYTCPSSPQFLDGTTGYFRTTCANAAISISSTTDPNFAGLIYFDASRQYPSKKISNLKNVSSYIAMTEQAARAGVWLGSTGGSFVRGPTDQLITLHKDKMIYLFVDGHAESKNPKDTIKTVFTTNKADGLWSCYQVDR